MGYEDKVCDFKKYAMQTVDLMVDAYKWKVMANECDDEKLISKYMMVSDTLLDLFMEEHNAIGEMFKSE